MKLAWRRKIGVGSDADSPAGRVLRGATIDSSSMLMGKLARLRVSMVGIEGSCLRSLTTKRGIDSHVSILNMPEWPGPEDSLTSWPAIHGKPADSRWRPLVSISIITESGCEDAWVSEKHKHI